MTRPRPILLAAVVIDALQVPAWHACERVVPRRDGFPGFRVF